jgi:hypothetical protein
MRELDNLQNIGQLENGEEVQEMESLDEVLDLWVEELPAQTDHAAIPISTLTTASSAGSTLGTLTCISSISCS